MTLALQELMSSGEDGYGKQSPEYSTMNIEMEACTRSYQSIEKGGESERSSRGGDTSGGDIKSMVAWRLLLN